ncbi:MAG: class II fructose-bisphosphate aldolase [Candidatus Paceibacterota bacterium]|jgi:fructose-bisphosphate aldolase class II
MKTLKEYILEADKNHKAIGHFNISNLEALHGIYQVAKKLNLPVIIGLSEGEEEFFGKNEAVALIKEIREKDNYPIFLNADHHYSFESVKAVIDAGYDAVIFDGAKLPIEENIKITKQCVLYAKSINPNILVEGELGYIGTSSKMLDKIPEGISPETFTTPEDAKKYVEETGVDLFSPSVGNIHGMFKDMPNPSLNIERIKQIRVECGVPLVLHGGSGITDEDFIKAIEAGISIIHINTEIRVAFRKGLEESLKENPEEIAPYKLEKKSVEEIEKVVEARLKLFNGIK